MSNQGHDPGSSTAERVSRWFAGRGPYLLAIVLLALLLVAVVIRGRGMPHGVAHDHAAHEMHAHVHDEHAPHVHEPEEQITALRQLIVSPAARALMGVEVTPVERRHVTATVRMVGKVEFDETTLRAVTARARGRLDRLYVDFTGIDVREGDHLADIYSEDLIVAQEELIQATRAAAGRGQPDLVARAEQRMIEASRAKLRRLGLTDEQIDEVEQRERPVEHLTVYAHLGGTVVERLKKQGDRVEIGDRIVTTANLDHVWVRMDAYESDLAWLRYGQEVEVTTEAYSGERFQGRISFIDPVLDPRTRTVKVRVDAPNPDRKLKPEMFVRALVRTQIAEGGQVIAPDLRGKWLCRMHPGVVADEPGECTICEMSLIPAETFGRAVPRPEEVPPPLVIPVSAALVTGTRAIVYVEDPAAEQPTFEGREILLGPRAGDYYLVKHGLEEGELVVTRGNFKIDADLQIAARPSMMSPEGAPAAGHDHGHMHDRDLPMPDEGEVMTGPMPVPSEVAAQLHSLETFATEVRQAVRSEEIPRIRDAYQRFGETLDAVEGERLTGHARMVWNELEMLLRNDAVEGAQVEQVRDARRVLDSLNRDIRRLREQFVVEHDQGQHHVH